MELFRDNLLASERIEKAKEAPKLQGFAFDGVAAGNGGADNSQGQIRTDGSAAGGGLYIRKEEEPPSIMRATNQRLVNINFEVLQKEFDTYRLAIEADWNEWLKKTSFQLLK